jgi:hypothetical protein
MRPVIGLCAVLAAATLLAHSTAYAEVYRCVAANGRTLFTDSPCPKGMRTTDVTRAPRPCTTPACIEQAREQQAQLEQQLAAASQLAELRRIQELEQEVAALRASLQSAQSAPAPEAVQPQVYPGEEALYPGVVMLGGGCVGRGCRPHRPADRDGDGHRHSDGDHRKGNDGDGRARVRTVRPSAPG